MRWWAGIGGAPMQIGRAQQIWRARDGAGCYHAPMRVAAEIEARLAGLEPQRLELADESARHAGHAGARPQGESHFRLLIVAEAFTGRSRLERQRLVYGALGDLLRTDVHALSITALSPAEAAARQALPRKPQAG
jgi:BolA family transcriptional regulator, general stress-responsive regulator